MHTPDVSLIADPPRNGLAGLRHWRHDLLAGLVVSFVSLPLSSGIAIASGAPPIYGLISSIIAGLVFPMLGGSFVTISGPAAGLAPALLATMASLGGAGDAEHVGAGYGMLLVVICAVGVAQILGARLGLARLAAVFPASVVEGMLAAIGVLILVKALPLALGILEPVHAHGFLEYAAEIPHWMAAADPASVGIAAGCLAVFGVLGLGAVKRRAAFRTVPPHVFAVGVGAAAAAVLGMGGDHLISVPAHPLSGVRLPDFSGLLGQPDLWRAALTGFTTLLLIDGVESLATAQAIDRADPYKRRSVPDKVLRAMGVSNLVSSLLGGLTVIPGGVKSKTCIEAGGRTLWANFANAMFLLGFLFVAPGLVSLIPKAALGAVLVYTGWKMAHPRIATGLSRIGREQLVLYALTIAVMLLTDLLVGILVGTALKLVFVTWKAHGKTGASWPTVLASMFRDPVVCSSLEGDTLTLRVDRPLVCFNAFKLIERLERQHADVRAIIVELGPGTTLIDHTAADGVFHLLDIATPHQPIEVRGMETLHAGSDHRAAMRQRPAADSLLTVSGG